MIPKKQTSPVERKAKNGKVFKRNNQPEQIEPVVPIYEKKEVVIGNDDKLEGGIYMWDIKAIRKKRTKEEKQKEKKQQLNFRTTPYMQDLDKDVIKMYQCGEDDQFVHEKMHLDLNKHTGMYRPVAPAFGIPLMKFSEDPVEAFNSGSIQINNYEELKDMKNYLTHYQQNKFAVNLKRAVHGSSPMRA